MSNFMGLVSEILGVELGEEFEIKGFDDLYVLRIDGLHAIDNKRNLENANPTLVQLLMGNCEIIKKPWKPKLGEKYYSLIVNDGPVRRIIYIKWDNDDVDKRRYKNGFVFKTVEEAEEMAEKISAFVKKERGIE